MDFSEWFDIVIGDYNYLFDPRVYLSRFFADDNKDAHIILIDEAHNLPARSRQMYSSFLELSALRRVEQLLSAPDIADLGPTKHALNRLRQIIGCLDGLLPYLRDLGLQFADQNLLGTKINQQELLRTERFIGARKPLANFISNIGSLVNALGQFLDCFPEWESRRTVLELWFELNFFLRVLNPTMTKTISLWPSSCKTIGRSACYVWMRPKSYKQILSRYPIIFSLRLLVLPLTTRGCYILI